MGQKKSIPVRNSPVFALVEFLVVVAIIAIIAAILLPVSAALAIGGNAGGTTPPRATTPQVSLAFVTNNTSDYWIIAHKGVLEAQEELPNVNVQFVIPADGTAQTQNSQVDDLLAKGVQGIAISPVDPMNQTQMIDDAEKKTHIFTQDSDAPPAATASAMSAPITSPPASRLDSRF